MQPVGENTGDRWGSTRATRRLLASGVPGLGGAPLGNLFRAMPDRDAIDLVAHAYAAGVRYFDTAPHYGHGRSERRFGDALRPCRAIRIVLSTKVGRLLTPESDAPRDQHGYADTLPFVQHYDYTGAGVRRSLEDSRQRLGLARIDIAYVHDIDGATHGDDHPERLRDALESGLPELARQKADGALRGYGLGVNDVAICQDVLRHADVDVILLAGRYTLADQTALRELLPLCIRRGVAIVIGGPFNSGILATGAQPADGSQPYFNYVPAPRDVIARVSAIEAVCDEFDVPLKAAALQFPAAHPAVVNVVPGARSRAELDDNLALARHPIPAGFWRTLRERRLVDPAAPLPGFGDAR